MNDDRLQDLMMIVYMAFGCGDQAMGTINFFRRKILLLNHPEKILHCEWV